MEALEAISENKSEKPATRCESSGYLRQLQRMETAILSTVWGEILQRFNVTSKQLQSIDIDLGVTSELYGSLANYIEDARKNYDHYEYTAIEKSSITDYEDTFKRQKKRKLHCDETSHGDTVMTGKKYFQVNTYNVVMDTLSSELNRRRVIYKELHNQFSFITNMPALSTDEIADKATKLTHLYNIDLPADPANFINECLHFRGFLKTLDVVPGTALQLSKIIHEKGVKDIYPYINIALRIFLCMPASNCTAERSFSILRRIKNYLRSTMAQTRLNSLAVLSIESNLARDIDYSDLIDSFASQQSRKKNLK